MRKNITIISFLLLLILSFSTHQVKTQALENSNDRSVTLNEYNLEPNYVDERHVLTNKRTLKPFGFIRAEYKRHLVAGSSYSQTVTLGGTVSGSYAGFTLSFPVTFSTTYTVSGPVGNERVGSLYATHRAYSTAYYGELVEKTYDVYGTLSGKYLRTFKVITFDKTQTHVFANLINISPSAVVTVRNTSDSRTKTYNSLESWKTNIRNYGISHINW